MGSLSELMKQPLEIPHYSTLCRRQEALPLTTYHGLSKDEPIHLVADSSGLKIYGEGEWKVKMHGTRQRRTWRKLHIGLNPKTGEIVTHHVTLANVHDAEVLPTLLEQVKTPISKVTLDGIYDTINCYQTIANKGAIPIIPPRKNAAISNSPKLPQQLRNWAITQVNYHGDEIWKQFTDYHQRSHVENAFFRLKTLFGHAAKNRSFDHQVTELSLRCNILNRFTQLGMPDSYLIN
jgi:IS5 family transposase